MVDQEESDEAYFNTLKSLFKQQLSMFAGEHTLAALLDWTKAHIAQEEHDKLIIMAKEDPEMLWNIGTKMVDADPDSLTDFIGNWTK